MKFYERIIDCEMMLKYLYDDRTKEDIELETVLDRDNGSVSNVSLRNWKFLDKPMKKDRIQKLRNDNIVYIAEIEDVGKLCTMINTNASTPNAKRVFNLLVSNHGESQKKLRLYITEENVDTPLAVYMTKILKVKLKDRKYLSYLPGRSVTLEMLCDLGRELYYTKKGIVQGLKSLIALGLVEAFAVEPVDNDQYEVRKINEDEIDMQTADIVVYRLSVLGCKKYMKQRIPNCAK